MKLQKVEYDPYFWFGIITSFIGIVCGIIAAYFLYQFQSFKTFRFLKLRKPNLIVCYCCGSICNMIALCPATIYIDLYVTDMFWRWFFHFIQEWTISCMLVMIAARCWLLYYDHSYGVALVDKNWRGAITHQKNFWLKHRKTWGDLGFILCVAITAAVTLLIIFCSISIYTLQSENLRSLHVVSLLSVAGPSFLLSFFMIFSKKSHKLSVYDELMIIKEMRYLCLCTLLINIAYILEISEILAFMMVAQSGQILFSFFSSYIQTRWIIKQLVRQNRLLLKKKAVLKAPNNTNTQHLAMSDILKTKDGFTMFMRHCQNELNVEGLLFIVEVAQYKAKLHGILHPEESKENTTVEIEISTNERSYTATSISNKYSHTKPTVSIHSQEPITRLPALSRIGTTVRSDTDFELDQFESNILQRDWIPISKQLFKPKHQHRDGKDLKWISDELEMVYRKDSDELHVHPEDEEKNEMMILQRQDAKMYEYAQHLFLKYIDCESDFTINVSYGTRKEMLLFFSKHRDKGFEFILEKNDIVGTLVNDDKYDQMVRSLIIKQHLYGVFDEALREIWKLLSSDTYLRFIHTKQYDYLLEQAKKIKNKN